MSYSIAKAELIADQLSRLSTQHAHQLVGQLSNLEFWMSEAASAIAVINDYPARFRRLHDAQVEWVSSQDVSIPFYCPVCQGECEFSPGTPQGPRRIPSEELGAARDRVRKAAAQLLLRLFRAEFVEPPELRRYINDLELPIEPEDLDPGVDD
ncbi:MAG TPA: hypothetical protein VER96_07035 [Polyangiaceae bacterium]|nr:hypothetical protein [Polyangiaceae bacterium]